MAGICGRWRRDEGTLRAAGEEFVWRGILAGWPFGIQPKSNMSAFFAFEFMRGAD
jgi:xanthine/uracil/vitamin C permease (AzgA family)